MKLDILESIPFFSVLEKEELTLLALHMEYHITTKHSMIFLEGDAAEYFYILSQ